MSLVFKVMADVENYFSIKKLTTGGRILSEERNPAIGNKMKEVLNFAANDVNRSSTNPDTYMPAEWLDNTNIQSFMKNDVCTKVWDFCDASWISKNGKAGQGFHLTNSDNEDLCMGFCRSVSSDVLIAKLKAIWLSSKGQPAKYKASQNLLRL
ncbi:hypothetical protein Cni_G19719 [Canna indica]|uniref:Uncharacterized protein n=1 Tax=Canna indica TaxID=4628 RepID=A0AAQ3KLT7_9LILI|nr:hypothetical protein Cni_G19719 [Canna indica]